MTIHPETEIVASSYDAATRVHSYTIERGGKRWTTTIPDDEFERFGPVVGASAATNKARRRNYLAAKLTNAMQGEPDA
jgi:hypothetical protein